MILNDMFPNDDHDRPLPCPNAAFITSEEGLGTMTEEKIRGIICNPVYTGVGPFPALISDEQWVHAGAKLIEDEGPEQFLVNILHILRKTFPAQDGD